MSRIKKRIRDNTTPRHMPAKVLQVADIPRTKSGKIVELAVRDVIHGRAVKNVEALANPEALEHVITSYSIHYTKLYEASIPRVNTIWPASWSAWSSGIV